MKDDGKLRVTTEGGVKIEVIELVERETEETKDCWIFTDKETVNYLFHQHQIKKRKDNEK